MKAIGQKKTIEWNLYLMNGISVIIIIHALLCTRIRIYSNESFIISLDVLSPSMLAFDDLLNGPFGDFMKFSNQIGGDVQQQVSVDIET